MADGADEEVVFGVGTKIGTRLDLQLPTIHNNSVMIWVHVHPMFRSSTFTYTGVYGLVDIIDHESRRMVHHFSYGDNHLMLTIRIWI